MLRLCALFLVLALLFPAAPTFAGRTDTPDYRKAFEALDAKQFQVVRSVANRGSDVVLNKVLRATLMAQPGNDFSFDEMAGFVTEHPDWPSLSGILMIAEQKIPSNATAAQIINWFTAHPPLTLPAFYRYTEALDAMGQGPKAATLVRDRWVNRDFSGDELAAYQARFAPLLTAEDHNARLDRLLMANNITAARTMYVYVSPDMKTVAEARMALANQLSNAEALLAQVPSHLQNDPGLLYERLRWRRKADQNEGAIEILTHAPEQLAHADAWWDERAIIIRRVMERKNYTLAYQLAADHGQESGFDYIQAEFIAGWLALRFLNRPDLAVDHFRSLLDNAGTPISRARGAYWLGRTLEALKQKAEAEQAYETAATLNTTFYGQLAVARLYAKPIIKASPEPAIPANVRSAFFARDSIQATEKLSRIGQIDRARSFFKAATEAANQRVEFVLLMELAYELQRPDWAINAAKAANQKNMVVAAGAFPTLAMRLPAPPDPAFTHALIRQESLFNADAGSPVGARGLMQLMPATAKDVAKKLGLPYSPARLTDPDYNVRLGTTFAQEQLDRFDGSYILALAGYNAGPRRVREWMDQFGDPRSPRVDPIDWIEMMPIYETRNYVQRIMENFQIYRARLNGGSAPLTLLQDLKR